MNTRENPSYSSKRTRETIKFCDIPPKSKVLDIGQSNKLSQQMAREKNIHVVNTFSDLDYSIDTGLDICFDYVTCFEVIEHLLNPRMFFDNLYKMTKDDIVVYLSYPSRPKCMWNDDEHFHEYDRLRFEYLLKITRFTIVREKNIYVPRLPNGIRPLIRNFIPQTTIYEIKKLY